MVPQVFVKHPAVTQFVVGGADLMLPGVNLALLPEQPFKQGDLLAVCVQVWAGSVPLLRVFLGDSAGDRALLCCTQPCASMASREQRARCSFCACLGGPGGSALCPAWCTTWSTWGKGEQRQTMAPARRDPRGPAGACEWQASRQAGLSPVVCACVCAGGAQGNPAPLAVGTAGMSSQEARTKKGGKLVEVRAARGPRHQC